MSSKLYLTIDISEVFIDDNEKLSYTPQLDFAHEIIYSLNRTSLWQMAKIYVLLETEKATIEISPVLSVSPSLKEFRHQIKSVMLGKEIKSGKISLMKIKTDAPKLPKIKYTVDPYANKVMDPNAMNDEPVLLCLSINPSAGRNEHVCFSKYPLPPINQCLNVVAAIEKRLDIA